RDRTVISLYALRTFSFTFNAIKPTAMYTLSLHDALPILRAAYLKQMKMSARKQREVKKVIRMSSYLRQPTRPSIGAKEGSIPVYGPHSSAIGKLAKSFR